MRTYKTKEIIRNRLLASLRTGEGIRTEARSMPNGGSHHWWLTGTEEDYVIHCFGSGQGWRDQTDICGTQDLDEVVSHIWQLRAAIIEQ